MQITELPFIYPEIWLLSMACFILILDLFVPKNSKLTYLLSQMALLGVLFFTLPVVGNKTMVLFNQQVVVDNCSQLLKFSIAFIGFFVFLYSRKYICERPQYQREHFVLCLFSILGMMVLVSARSFLSLYLGLELLALPLYALIVMVKPGESSAEAAMKYFIMGALASGMLLYGISLLYGATGSFEMQIIAENIALSGKIFDPLLLLGLVFVITGLAFKFGVVPFHMWLPDVYEGSPLPVTLFLGTLPKLAAFGFAIRLLADTFPALQAHWQPLLMAMSVASLAIGNLAAIAQTNLKRMLAYSTISHMGFLLLGLLAGPQLGFAAALDYVIIYAVMALGVFGLMTTLSSETFEAETLQDFRGLWVRHPWMAGLMMILLLSLAGIPPFAGFYAKFFVLDALIKADYIGLAVVALLLTVVGAFYYLRVIRVMFFEEPLESTPAHTSVPSIPMAMALSFNGLAIVALGIFPTPLFNLCHLVLALPK